MITIKKKRNRHCCQFLFLLVPRTGLEPARLAARAPETRASTIPPPGQEKNETRCFWYLEPRFALRAENETRTRDPDLGKVVLYQLSYFRLTCVKRRRLELPRLAALPPQSSASTNSATSPYLVTSLSQNHHLAIVFDAFPLNCGAKIQLFSKLAKHSATFFSYCLSFCALFVQFVPCSHICSRDRSIVL